MTTTMIPSCHQLGLQRRRRRRRRRRHFPMMRREVGEKGSLHQSQNAQEDVDIIVVVYICCHLAKGHKVYDQESYSPKAIFSCMKMKSCREQPISTLSNIQPASHLQTNWNPLIACITSTTMIKHVAGKCISRSQQLQLLFMLLSTGLGVVCLPFLNVRQEGEGTTRPLSYLLMIIFLLHMLIDRWLKLVF